MKRFSGFLFAALLLVSGIVFFSCTTSGNETRQVEFKLDDSLTAYDKVKITLLDDKDTAKVLAVVFNAKLTDAKSVKDFTVPDSIGDFRVRVQGFDDQGLLVYQSTVEVKGDAAGTPDRLPPEALPGLISKLPGGRLASLDVSDGILTPAFDTNVFAYTLEVPFRIDSLSVNAVAEDSGSTLTWDGKPIVTGAASTPVKLDIGSKNLAVSVTPKGGSIANKYVITVTRNSGDDNRLKSLAVTSGTLSPSFDPAKLAYDDTVENAVDLVQITALPEDSNAVVVIVADTAVAGVSKPLDLTAGSPFAALVKVISADGFHEKTYTVVFNRKLSADGSLSDLRLSDGAPLIPDFDPNVFQYKAVTASDKVSFIPTAAQDGAKIQVDGAEVFNGKESALIDAKVGVTPIIITVTPPNGGIRFSYVVQLERSSPNALLQSLAVQGATLDSAFQKSRFTYKSVVPRTTGNTTLVFETADANATIKVQLNGDSIPSGILPGGVTRIAPINLKVGLNVAKVEVTAPDKVSKTSYTVNVLRQPATIADLSLLDVQGLKPAFSPTLTSYTADTVAFFFPHVTVQAQAKDSNALVVLRLKRRTTLVLKKETAPPVVGLPAPPHIIYETLETDTLTSAKSSVGLNLEVGENLIELEVTAEDGSTRRFYDVFMQRKPSPNPLLSSLVITPTGGTVPLTLTPSFTSNVFKYIDTTFATYVTVVPKGVEAQTTILVNGSAVPNGGASGSITLASGINVITVATTSPDKANKAEYQIRIDKRVPIIKQPPPAF